MVCLLSFELHVRLTSTVQCGPKAPTKRDEESHSVPHHDRQSIAYVRDGFGHRSPGLLYFKALHVVGDRFCSYNERSYNSV